MALPAVETSDVLLSYLLLSTKSNNGDWLKVDEVVKPLEKFFATRGLIGFHANGDASSGASTHIKRALRNLKHRMYVELNRSDAEVRLTSLGVCVAAMHDAPAGVPALVTGQSSH